MKIKQTLKLLLVAFLLSTTVGCKRMAEKNDTFKTDERLDKIENIELNKVPDSTYSIDSNDKNSIAFSKSTTNSSTKISVRTFKKQSFGDEDEFIKYAENYIENQMKSYKMKSFHIEIQGFKNTTCVRFDGTFRDSTNLGNNQEYISQEGYLCLIPDGNSKIAEIKVIHYSNERFMPKDVVYAYQGIIDQLEFTKN